MTNQAPSNSWNLLADIGGSNARFAYTSADTFLPKSLVTYEFSEFQCFDHILIDLKKKWLAIGLFESALDQICIAVAAPIDQTTICLTNNLWRFSRKKFTQQTGCKNISVVNDFAAVARSLPELKPEHYEVVGDSNAIRHQTMVTIGPGTGTGVASVTFDAYGRAIIIPSEGGHVDFAPITELESEILNLLRKEFGRVSIERILSGPGIMNLYRALGKIRDLPTPLLLPREVAASAQISGENLARETMLTFFAVLGSVAGDLALSLGAKGGVFIAGGIVPRNLELLRKSNFRTRFVAKGRYKEFNDEISTKIITHPNPGLLGAALIAKDNQAYDQQTS